MRQRLLFYTWAPNIFPPNRKLQNIIHRSRNQVFAWRRIELMTPANDGTFPGDADGRAEVSMCVLKRGFMVETL